MKFGICTSLENAPAAKSAGWDFVEERVDLLLQGLLPDAEWKGAERAATSVLPIPAANVLVPGSLKITGPDASLDKLRPYMTTVLSRAKKIGIKSLVFGSGGARKVPEGFDVGKAKSQITEFLRMIAPIAQQNGVTMVIEPLNRGETNIINSVAEGMEYVRAVNHPNIQCLVDSYHFWLENESLENITNAGKALRHVHVADKDGRVAPGQSGKADYRPFFAALKKIGYDGPISVEGKWVPDMPSTATSVLTYLKDQWNNC